MNIYKHLSLQVTHCTSILIKVHYPRLLCHLKSQDLFRSSVTFFKIFLRSIPEKVFSIWKWFRAIQRKGQKVDFIFFCSLSSPTILRIPEFTSFPLHSILPYPSPKLNYPYSERLGKYTNWKTFHLHTVSTYLVSGCHFYFFLWSYQYSVHPQTERT